MFSWEEGRARAVQRRLTWSGVTWVWRRPRPVSLETAAPQLAPATSDTAVQASSSCRSCEAPPATFTRHSAWCWGAVSCYLAEYCAGLLECKEVEIQGDCFHSCDHFAQDARLYAVQVD